MILTQRKPTFRQPLLPRKSKPPLSQDDFIPSSVFSQNLNKNHRFISRAEREATVPVKEIILALVLLVLGSTLLGVDAILYYKNLPLENCFVMSLVALILFIPGSFYTVVALLCWIEYPGFTYELIPSYDN